MGQTATLTAPDKLRINLGGLTLRQLAEPHIAHRVIMDGIPVRTIRQIAIEFGLTPENLAERCGLSRSTYHRRAKKPSGKLGGQESDALARHALLMARAVDVFGGDLGATRQWFTTPQVGLGGEIPLEWMRTTVGYREVEKLLNRIDYGVYA